MFKCHSSERSRNRGEDKRFVFPHVCMHGLITRYRINRLPSPPLPRIRTRIPPRRAADKVLWAQRKPIRCVFLFLFLFFLVMVELITTAHAVIGATTQRYISTINPEGPPNGMHYYFPFTYTGTHIRSASTRDGHLYPCDLIPHLGIVLPLRHT